MVTEKELLKQFTEIAEREGFVILPKSYYERLFNGFEKLKRDMLSAREARDKYKEELKACRSSNTSSPTKTTEEKE